MESFNDTFDDILGGGAGNESSSDVAATTESEFFIDPPDDPSLVPCISFVLKSDIKVRQKREAAVSGGKSGNPCPSTQARESVVTSEFGTM